MGVDNAEAAVGNRGSHDWVRDWRVEGTRIVGSAVVLALSIWATLDPPATWEVGLFRRINEIPRQGEWLLWPLQQAGMALAVPVGAVILWTVVRDWRPPLALLVGGIIFGWGAAKLMKTWVNRGRPGALLDDVSFGFDVPIDGFGFPSGHAVVALTLAMVFTPYASRWLWWLLLLAAGAVCFSRVYMGAHLPLDVLGGAACGIIIGSIVNLASGVRRDRRGHIRRGARGPRVML